MSNTSTSSAVSAATPSPVPNPISSYCPHTNLRLKSAPVNRYPTPPIPFNRQCAACSLGYKNPEVPSAVGGAGPTDLSQVKLIIVSDYPSNLEVKHNYPFFDNDALRRQRQPMQWRNAGSILRALLFTLFGLDTYTDCWITNAIKCDPKQHQPENTHLKICSQTWLLQEMTRLNEAVCDAPILILGRHAFNAMKLILDAPFPSSLNEGLRRPIFWLNHPIVFAQNPAQVSRSPYHLETRVVSTPKSELVKSVLEVEWIIPGSPLWHYANDLEVLRPFLRINRGES